MKVRVDFTLTRDTDKLLAAVRKLFGDDKIEVQDLREIVRNSAEIMLENWLDDAGAGF